MDYQAIIENLSTASVIELMKKLGADRYREEENQIIFPTICHNMDVSEASMKLYFYKNTKLFYCYTEEGAMNIFKFLRVYYETRGIEYDWKSDILDVILDCSNYRINDGFSLPKYQSLKSKYGIARKNVELPNYNKRVLDTFVKTYPVEWLKDGISRAAMDKFNILYSISQNKIIIPHYGIDGALVGIRGRALNDWEIENVGKYMPIKVEQTWYTHPLSMNLYGIYENWKDIKKTGICYLFESEKSIMQLESFDIPHCAVAVCGSQLNKFQVHLLLKHCQPREMVICFDKEELPNEDKYFNKLYSIGKKYQKYCNFSFIYDRDNLLSLKDSPSDRGQEIFQKLLQKRVKIR